jgi:hypothetical protein
MSQVLQSKVVGWTVLIAVVVAAAAWGYSSWYVPTASAETQSTEQPTPAAPAANNVDAAKQLLDAPAAQPAPQQPAAPAPALVPPVIEYPTGTDPNGMTAIAAELADLRKQLAAADAEVEKYREEARQREITAAQDEAAAAKAELAKAREELAKAKEAKKQGTGTVVIEIKEHQYYLDGKEVTIDEVVAAAEKVAPELSIQVRAVAYGTSRASAEFVLSQTLARKGMVCEIVNASEEESVDAEPGDG